MELSDIIAKRLAETLAPRDEAIIDLKKGIGEVANVLGEVQSSLLAHIEGLKSEIAELKSANEELTASLANYAEKSQIADVMEAVPTVEEVAKAIADSEVLVTTVDVVATKWLEDNPPIPGRDGKDGADGKDGRDGKDGEKGADGVGLAGALIDRDGSLVVTLTNGEVKSLGSVVGKDGANGADGRDGFSLEHFSAERDEDGTITMKFADQNVSKAFQFNIPVVQYRGYWREGRKCAEGHAITHNGSLWIAKRDTCAEPSAKASDDWYLAVLKGRDGRDGYDGKNFGERPPINLRGE